MHRERTETAAWGGETPTGEPAYDPVPNDIYIDSWNGDGGKIQAPATQSSRLGSESQGLLDTSSHDVLLSCKGRWTFIILFAIFQTTVGF